MAETKTEKPDPKRAAAAQPAKTLVHEGYMVVSPIRYANVQGEVKSAGVGEVVKDLTEGDRELFESKGHISPHLIKQ